MDPLLIVLIVVVVLAVAGGIWFYAGRNRGGELPPEVSAHKPISADDVLLAPPQEPVTEPEPAPGGPAPDAAAPTTAEPTAPATLERPESIPGRMQRLRSRLAGAGGFGRAILSVLSRGDLTEADWEEIEDTLLTSDLGIEVTSSLMDELRTQAKVLDTSDPAAIRAVLRAELLQLVDPSMDRSLNLAKPTPAAGWNAADGEPAAAVLMVGVNGTGKTTTCGKLARVLVADGKTAVMGAADTFRAAAADQLTTWGQRVGVEVIRSEREGADPASVAYDATREAARGGVDVVVVDTAGRLQNKAGLMDELGKIKRVMEKVAPVGEVLLVLDATTGQNGMRQAQVFSEAVGITGIVLTKLDGTAKGGIVVTVQKELGVPVKLVGLGEGADDLAPFDPEGFVDALLG
ncbi:MAG: signal recognition particle-docking protein FtsY [Actinomyces ruminicola]|uniref:Signal recognition particle receptor FtsY n=1 Tax=Actinomyces ruminicola TaxID=332524 RepID=A0A1G9TUU0_9ACTO|nr:signal recognition particle-docking protein FtsY [Actinomyces ruminicola]MBE6481207.1 signal recognition particle-docking protein FtsY [Actinomyces ruminicola]SDM51433.1 fused signal recognition particle receptor [Actinomyces ruminicola]